MGKAKYANVGGQAVMEGIMMRSPKKSVLAVRTPEGEIVTEEIKWFDIRNRLPIFRIPILRGMASFVESLVSGFSSITRSAELSGLDDAAEEAVKEGETATEKESKKAEVLKASAIILAVVLGVALCVGLFIFLPVGIRRGLEVLFSFSFGKYWSPIFEGVLKMAIFLVYILLVSRMREIRRVFEYHGAEHKTIFCFEAGEDLIPENVRRQSRLHPRCGTSFIVIVMIVSIIVAMFLPKGKTLVYVLLKILILPVIAGISFELIRLAGKYDNVFTRIISAPGKALQLITTKEPDDSQIEVAIAALKASLCDSNDNIDTDAAYKE